MVGYGGFNLALFVSLLFLGKVLDLCTTYYALTNGLGYEVGTISLFLLERGGWMGLVVSNFFITSAVALGFVVYQRRLIRNNAPRWWFMLLGFGAYACIFITVIAVINNFIIICTS